MALGKIQHLYNISYIADACVLGKQLWLPILCHPHYNQFIIKLVEQGSSLLSNVRTQFAEFLMHYYLYALVFSTYRPVSVLGYGKKHIFSRTI
jgi:hypothetical protein